MIRLRHILHPVRSATTLYRRIEESIYKGMAERAASKLSRRDIARCWCGGELRPFKWHPAYAVCAGCGCYVNRRPPRPEALKDAYTLKCYWRVRQRSKGYPPIEQRGEVYRSDGRLDYWLSLVERFAPTTGRVIEIGCSPGVLLLEMRRRGYECTGVEPDQQVADWIQRSVGVEVRSGVFPGVSLPPCDLFLAFDVAEHVPDPLKFWNEVAGLLKPGAVAILQTPVECHDYDHPFKERPDFFDEVEHLFLFTDNAIRKLTAAAQLQLVALEDARASLGQICVLRKP